MANYICSCAALVGLFSFTKGNIETRALLLLTNASSLYFDDLWANDTYNDPNNNKSVETNFLTLLSGGDFKSTVDPTWGDPIEVRLLLINSVGLELAEFDFDVAGTNISNLSSWLTSDNFLYSWPYTNISVFPTIRDGNKEVLLKDSDGTAMFAIVHEPQWPTALMIATNTTGFFNTSDMVNVTEPVPDILITYSYAGPIQTIENKQRALEKENVPKNYNGIANMKADKLKKLGKIFNIDPKLPKKARIVLLCQVLGISTTGTHQSVVCRTSELLSASQKEELFKLTAAYMCQLTNWSKDLASVPDIEVSSVKKYLVKSEVLRASDARTYKLSRPYALMNFVHSVLYCEQPGTFSVVRALCNASQSASSDEVKVVYVIIDKDFGEPYGGFCTCTVGNSERCGHIGAVLFKLTDLQSTGTTEGPSCTDTLCGWSDPKGCQAEPTVFSDLAIKKTANDTLRRTVEDYGAKVTHQAAPTYDQVTDLRAKLISATHHTGQYCPAIHVLNADRFREAKETVPVRTYTELPSTVALYDECLAPSKEETVHTTPATIPQLVGEKFYSSESAGFKEAGEKLFRAATSMNIDRNEVDIMTCGQSQNQEWHDQRQGAITATKFHRVMRVKEKYSDTLAKELVAKSSVENKKLQNVPAIKWGRRNESNARKAYFNKCAPFHKDFIVEEHGLMVYRHYNFIRGSPDGIVSCRCHGHTLLEIKCPFSARTMSVQEGVEKGIIKYLETVDGHLKLKENSAEGYYAQIQGLLGITGIQTCHLVVWTKKGFVTVTVRNDHKFFHTKIVPACTSFFKNYVVPKLLLKDEQNDEVSVSAVETKVAISSVETEVLVTTVETEKTENVRPTDIQPSKRKRVVKKKTGKSVVLPKSPPSKYSSAKGILSELQQVTGIYQCRKCKKILPDDNVAEDNSNASVGCDCPNCGGCDTWMCWPCAQYDQEWADAGYDWHCPECTRECDIVY